MPDPISLATIMFILKILGGVMTFSTVIVGVFKVINWIKTKFISINDNVVELKNSMDTHISGLREDIKLQTSTIATALSEQRQDFRTFYAPSMLMQQMQSFQTQAAVPVRAKRAVRKKK